MVKYTRRHYLEIGGLIKKLPKKQRKTEFNKWNKIFKRDNPRYDSNRFKKYLGLNPCPRKKTKRRKRKR